MALWIGEDLTDAGSRNEVRRHLSRCPACRARYKRLKAAFRVLEQTEGQPTYDSSDTMWPEVASRIAQRRPGLRGRRFNGWLPFSAMAAACLLLVVVMEMQPDPDAVTPGSAVPRDIWSGALLPAPDPSPEPHHAAEPRALRFVAEPEQDAHSRLTTEDADARPDKDTEPGPSF